MIQPEDVLSYWFGDGDRDDPDVSKNHAHLWWGHAPETDAEIQGRFGATAVAAGEGRLDAWAETPHGRLALVIVLDQFSRNIHRDSGRMYEHDDRAVRLALEGIDAGEPESLAFFEKVFAFMPLMHAEDRELQARCVACFEELVRDAPTEALRAQARNNLDFAIRHRDIVDRFGRFPHRNALLGRPSTAEEEAFLKEPGSSF